jgi:hypothetical protein
MPNVGFNFVDALAYHTAFLDLTIEKATVFKIEDVCLFIMGSSVVVLV